MSWSKRWICLIVVAACGDDAGAPDGPVTGADAADVDAVGSTDAAAVAIDAPVGTVDGPAGPPTIVYVVRHAETTGVGTNPGLSAAGMARANALALRLADADVVAIYSSQYTRTHDTGVPTATAAGRTVQVVTVNNANAATYGTQLATAARSHAGTGNVLIVGHSNTVPDTVLALGGTTVSPISETEFNRIYTITLAPEGARMVESTY